MTYIGNPVFGHNDIPLSKSTRKGILKYNFKYLGIKRATNLSEQQL